MGGLRTLAVAVVALWALGAQCAPAGADGPIGNPTTLTATRLTIPLRASCPSTGVASISVASSDGASPAPSERLGF